MLDFFLNTLRVDFKTTLAHGITAGVASLLLVAGIRLVMKVMEDLCYIEAAIDAPHWAIRLAVRAARWSGCEPMPEWECPAEMLPDDRVRVWLAQT